MSSTSEKAHRTTSTGEHGVQYATWQEGLLKVLGELEGAIISTLWESTKGPLSVSTIQRRVARMIGMRTTSTIQSTLTRMYTKGLVDRQEDTRVMMGYLWSATMEESAFRTWVAQQLVDSMSDFPGTDALNAALGEITKTREVS